MSKLRLFYAIDGFFVEVVCVVGAWDGFTDEGLMGLYLCQLCARLGLGDRWRRGGVWALRRPLPLRVLGSHLGETIAMSKVRLGCVLAAAGLAVAAGFLVWAEPRAWDCPVCRGHGSV